MSQLVNVYSILDSKAQAFNMPFFAPNHSVAFRVIERSMKNPQSGFADFPADFTLFKVGDFNGQTGVITPCTIPENLGNLVQFLPPPAPVNHNEPPLPFASDKAAG